MHLSKTKRSKGTKVTRCRRPGGQVLLGGAVSRAGAKGRHFGVSTLIYGYYAIIAAGQGLPFQNDIISWSCFFKISVAMSYIC